MYLSGNIDDKYLTSAVVLRLMHQTDNIEDKYIDRRSGAMVNSPDW